MIIIGTEQVLSKEDIVPIPAMGSRLKASVRLNDSKYLRLPHQSKPCRGKKNSDGFGKTGNSFGRSGSFKAWSFRSIKFQFINKVYTPRPMYVDF